MSEIRCVLFDLDGTLLDTSYDFAWALNTLRTEENLPPVPYWQIRQTISQGGKAVIQLGFPDVDDEVLESLRQRFLQLYHDHIAVHTQLFPTLDQSIRILEGKNIPWGIVTNKPEWLTHTLLEKVELPAKPKTVVCGDTLPVRKPHAEPMRLAAQQCGIAPENCLYIGDHPRDIEAPLNAGMLSGAALYGYLPQNVDPMQWPAHFFYYTPSDILRHLEKL
jgi:phosphoglycolate phosphatase